MGRISPKLSLTPPRLRKAPQIKVLRRLTDSIAPERPFPLFEHARHQGETDFIPHSLGDQIQHGRDNAIVRSWESFRKALQHPQENTFRYLSPTFTLVDHHQYPDKNQ